MNKAIVVFLLLGLVITGPGLFSAPASAAELAELVSACEDCHGKDGASTEPTIPIIGGFSALYTIDSFTAYQDEARPCGEVKYPAGPHEGEAGDMCKVTKELSEEEIGQLAEHFAAKPFVLAKQNVDAALVKQGASVHKRQCKKCHEDGGSSPDDDAGILAGQWMPYMEKEFQAYSSGEREMPKKMKVKMDKLSGDDITALVHYYGSFQ